MRTGKRQLCIWREIHGWLGNLGGRAARQAHREHRAFARLARHRHVAAHHARELARESKPEPRPAVAARGQGIGLGEILNSLACCSAVMPMPVSATASSTQSRPSATLRTRSATSPFRGLLAYDPRLWGGRYIACPDGMTT